MSDISSNTLIQQNFERRDKILSVIMAATDVFLRGSLQTWQDNVLQVIGSLGRELGVKRIYLCKHREVTEQKVVTGVRYEWLAGGDQTRIDVPAMQQINMQEAGYGRWAGVLYHGGVISGKVSDLPLGERGWFMSADVKTVVVVPVFVEKVWWGFIALEDYGGGVECTQSEIDAIKTLAVTFGAAIRRKRAEEELQREKAFVEQKAREIEDIAKFPEQDPWPVLRVSKDGIVIYHNPSAKPLLQFWKVDVGQPVPAEWQQVVKEVFVKNQSREVDVEFKGKIFAVLVVPIVEGDYLNLYGRDVTQERRAEEMKTEFMSMASHQLRTPLTALRWSSERLLKKKETLTEQQVDMANTIHETAVGLARLVDDLLSVSRIERGKMEPTPSKGDLLKLLKVCLHELEIQAEEKQIHLEFEKQTELAEFMFDADLIKQVYLNLLSNAIKYTPGGGKVTTRVKYDNETKMVQVDVADTGMGIPEEEQANVFQRFYRSQRAVDQGIEGTGLGLSVAKMIIDKSGGRIWFESLRDQGTTFSFTLPYAGEDTHQRTIAEKEIETGGDGQTQNSSAGQIEKNQPSGSSPNDQDQQVVNLLQG